MINRQSLPREYPRRYLDPAFNAGDRESVAARFRELEGRNSADAASLRRWMEDAWELQDALDEEGSLRYVAMTCATEDPNREKAFLDFLTNVSEPSKTPAFRILRRYLASPYRARLPRGEFSVFDRSAFNQTSLFREENVPLETEVERLSQQYQKITGSQTVAYDGAERTMAQMGRYMESTDRRVREEAWRLTGQRRLRDRDALEDLFDRMRDHRGRLSANAGFKDYRSYAFRRLDRFDYGPSDCEAFHEAVERFVVPLVREIQENRRKQLGLDRLRPWDLACDPDGLPPLKPFEGSEKLAEGVLGILRSVDGEFGGRFAEMRRLGLLDLESRKGKAPGGYQTGFAEARVPFIFMNAAGVDEDVRTLLHESGHAMHAWLSRDLSIPPYRSAPIEFAEVASMSMELLGDPHLGVFYPDPKDAVRSIRRHLEQVLTLLPWIATIDAFQHWIYLHPRQRREERTACWLALRKRFGGIEDWSGLDEYQDHAWHRQLHLFEHPFYYIEYGIAQLGALQVWRNARADRKEGLASYKRGLACGGGRDLPGLFSAAGIRFDFSEDNLKPLLAEVGAELKRLRTAS